MGTYINRGNIEFCDIVSHEYIDKSGLIPFINATLNTEQRYSCVTRCRRFGKSMAAKMLCAYYDKSCDSRELFAGAYLTGILPIMRYNTESALNNFNEYSMIDPAYLAPFFGFTNDEVISLAKKYNAPMDNLKMWYDGYKIGREKSIYNPYSVIKSMQRGVCKSYWATTGAYDSVVTYIQMNFDGLKDDIIRMLAGEHVYN